MGNAALAAAIALAALAISLGMVARDKGLVTLIVGGGIYWTVVAVVYFVMRDRLRRIIGLPAPEA
jgi:hypothetical protein